MPVPSLRSVQALSARPEPSRGEAEGLRRYIQGTIPGAGGGTRTRMLFRPRILSPLRIPFRHPGRGTSMLSTDCTDYTDDDVGVNGAYGTICLDGDG